ncbi:MAG: hypothetical protein QM765_35240 [Myxococcales bacterium]
MRSATSTDCLPSLRTTARCSAKLSTTSATSRTCTSVPPAVAPTTTSSTWSTEVNSPRVAMFSSCGPWSILPPGMMTLDPRSAITTACAGTR